MEIRTARPGDATALAELHVACWAETYPGLVPAEEIARYDRTFRLRQWEQQIAKGTSRIMIAPGAGFAQVGPQRETALAARGYVAELYALYLTRAAQGRGLGRALFAAALGPAPGRLSAMVLDGNDRACRFYETTGARLAERRPERIGDAEITDLLYLWDAAPAP
ncbi:GNAT family N-acetyltransferase [Limimaricola pyoseonensis]|uniref:Ribosomal protein S18 acetylase RimI n=1 Tax=Limimaricola pyoseonensis TaxID=521013 RepID=A0A1G7F1G1_9RHOB|nr:GNAT family N-acetyltransferase [Limimaricola pyoseonensis]SDE69770.1 Ribosomal protein S18 acetylase RimI [Limimaricola pyoseonensis]